MTALAPAVRWRRSHTQALAAALALIFVASLATTVGPTSNAHINDLPIYTGYAHMLGQGLVPYHDFALEYPPLALLPMWLGGIGGLKTPGGYDAAFGVVMLVCGLVTLVATSRLAGPRAATAAWLVALSPLLTGALVRTHFDLFGLAILMVALVAFAAERPVVGFVGLALCALAKFLGALLVPAAAIWLLGRKQRRSALLGMGAFLAVIAVISAPFIGSGYGRMLNFHANRPLQIESAPALVALALGGAQVTGTAAHPDRFKSQGVIGGAADTVKLGFLILELLVLGFIAWRAAARPAPEWLLLCVYASLVAFFALGKVLSPQFLIWLVPFAALAWTWRMREEAVLTGLAVVLTQIEFPSHYWELVAQRTGSVLIVAARDAILIIVLLLLLARLAAPARSHQPDAALTR